MAKAPPHSPPKPPEPAPAPPPVTAAELCQHIKLPDDAKRMLQKEMSPGSYVGLLLERGRFDDAIQVLAHWLPKREAVWWSCLCTWCVFRPNDLPELEAAALRAAVRWVLNPSEEHRRAAQAAGEDAGIDTVAGAVAMAACWSEGTMAPADAPEVLPPPLLSAQTLVAALAMAAQHRPERKAEAQHQFVHVGHELAKGKHRWK